MDPLKEAFQKIKEDILSLKNDFYSMNDEIKQIKESINKIKTQTTFEVSQKDNILPHSDTHIDTQTHKIQNNGISNIKNQTIYSNIPLKEGFQTDIKTFKEENYIKKTPFQGLYPQNNNVSIRNDGVQTDKPTNTSTNTLSPFYDKNLEISQVPSLNNTISEFEKVNEILSSLDDVKKEIRNKFKSLTSQEMLVFSTLYTLEDQRINEIGYQILAKSLNLTESSIRDYINKLIKKGIPIEKTRLNNKKIILKVSENLKKIATLATILKLRNI